MKCDFCDNKATVFFTQLTDGEMKKVCLCDSCAKERGVTDPTGFALADMLLGTGKSSPIPQAQSQPSPPGGGRKCGTCGFSLDDLRRVRRFGCCDCYSTFAEEVTQMIHGLHKGATHSGKVPQGLMAQQILHQRLEELRAHLDQAISTESYEEAASIRDEIRNLETHSKP